jgi:hypothetical protein
MGQSHSSGGSPPFSEVFLVDLYQGTCHCPVWEVLSPLVMGSEQPWLWTRRGLWCVCREQRPGLMEVDYGVRTQTSKDSSFQIIEESFSLEASH